MASFVSVVYGSIKLILSIPMHLYRDRNVTRVTMYPQLASIVLVCDTDSSRLIIGIDDLSPSTAITKQAKFYKLQII